MESREAHKAARYVDKEIWIDVGLPPPAGLTKLNLPSSRTVASQELYARIESRPSQGIQGSKGNLKRKAIMGAPQGLVVGLSITDSATRACEAYLKAEDMRRAYLSIALPSGENAPCIRYSASMTGFAPP